MVQWCGTASAAAAARSRSCRAKAWPEGTLASRCSRAAVLRRTSSCRILSRPSVISLCAPDVDKHRASTNHTPQNVPDKSGGQPHTDYTHASAGFASGGSEPLNTSLELSTFQTQVFNSAHPVELYRASVSATRTPPSKAEVMYQQLDSLFTCN